MAEIDEIGCTQIIELAYYGTAMSGKSTLAGSDCQ